MTNGRIVIEFDSFYFPEFKDMPDEVLNGFLINLDLVKQVMILEKVKRVDWSKQKKE